jgi:predicted metalloprotease
MVADGRRGLAAGGKSQIPSASEYGRQERDEAMRLDDLPDSSHVEDRRGEVGGGGGGFGMPVGGGGLSIGAVVVLGLVGWALGIDPSLLIGGAEVLTGPSQPKAPTTARRTGTPQDDMGRFVSKVLGSTEVTWQNVFSKDGKSYRAPVLVLYRGSTHAQCGGAAQSAMGPFYCPADQKIYLDTSFFDQIATRFRGCDVGSRACQFSQAYVIAHEVGHHVQNLMGILARSHQLQRAAGSKAEANLIQVKVELQADCLAGVWAHHSDQQWKLIQPGDVEAALRTAAAIGDDTLQRKAQGYVVPDSFTHGSSAQRQRWFETGLKSGSVGSCNTFAAAQL